LAAGGQHAHKQGGRYDSMVKKHQQIVMTDLEYLNHAEKALAAIELACDRINDASDADIDNQRSGGMITLTFANRSQIIINLQKPLQEIWMAARSGGFHYKFSSGQWLNTKDGSEFFAALTHCASEQSGLQVVFSS
jgi:CyaY protein